MINRKFFGKCIVTFLAFIASSLPAIAAADTQSQLPLTHGPKNGTLYVHGGGGGFNRSEFANLIQDTNGDGAKLLVVITTPQGEKRLRKKYKKGFPFILKFRKKTKGIQVEELYLMKKSRAKSKKVVEFINKADAIWMTGGNQSYLTDVFNDTPALEAMHRLLDRGGVVGGLSAGAQVQTSFMTRGDYDDRAIMGDGKHQIGFGFIRNSVLDVHVAARGRTKDLLQVYSTPKEELQDPSVNTQDLLGMGVDEKAAMIIRYDQMEVVGKGNVYVFDARKWKDGGRPSFDTLTTGDKYNLIKRERVYDD